MIMTINCCEKILLQPHLLLCGPALPTKANPYRAMHLSFTKRTLYHFHQNPKLSSKLFAVGSSNTGFGGGCLPKPNFFSPVGDLGLDRSSTTRLLLRLRSLRGSGASSSLLYGGGGCSLGWIWNSQFRTVLNGKKKSANGSGSGINLIKSFLKEREREGGENMKYRDRARAGHIPFDRRALRFGLRIPTLHGGLSLKLL